MNHGGASTTSPWPKCRRRCSAVFPRPVASAFRRTILNPVVDVTRQLARWRVPLGYALGGVALWLADPTPRSLALGAAVGAVGEALRVWAAGHLEKGREVTNTGPYAVTRHPLYAGSTIMGVRSEEHTSELQSRLHLVCRLLLEKKKKVI